MPPADVPQLLRLKDAAAGDAGCDAAREAFACAERAGVRDEGACREGAAAATAAGGATPPRPQPQQHVIVTRGVD